MHQDGGRERVEGLDGSYHVKGLANTAALLQDWNWSRICQEWTKGTNATFRCSFWTDSEFVFVLALALVCPKRRMPPLPARCSLVALARQVGGQHRGLCRRIAGARAPRARARAGGFLLGATTIGRPMPGDEGDLRFAEAKRWPPETRAPGAECCESDSKFRARRRSQARNGPKGVLGCPGFQNQSDPRSTCGPIQD